MIDCKRKVMISAYFWTLLFVFPCSLIGSQSFGGSVLSRNNDVYYWEQKTAPTSHRSATVAKHHELKHANEGGHSSRRLFGRHVCTQNKMRMVPIKDVQSYCKPNYHSYLRRCDKDNSRYCSGYRVVYELAYRPVQRLIAKTESVSACCPGWTQATASSTDCKKAICRDECRNGGLCTKPGHCTCFSGWTGRTCEEDINECTKAKNTCDQDCTNTPGSYKCSCRSGFTLQNDGKSCKNNNENEKKELDEKLNKKMDDLQKRIDILEEWQQRLANDEDNAARRHQRDDRINSLSEQIAILEEKLADCSCNNRKDELYFPRPQK